jgi:hypothetical protein
MTINTDNTVQRLAGLIMTMLFAGVGAIFLMLPGAVIGFFNRISGLLGMKPAPPAGHHFFLVLAVSYMCAVTLLAWLMFRYPGEKIYPLILAQAKAASSILSILFFVIHQPFLIYLTNGIIDGAIALFVFVLYLRIKKPS